MFYHINTCPMGLFNRAGIYATEWHETKCQANGYWNMAPFNIKLKQQDQTVSLTVLPEEAGIFKIIYYAAVLTGVKKVDEQWSLIPTAELQAGDLPFYTPNTNSDRLELIIDETFVQSAGQAIDEQLLEAD